MCCLFEMEKQTDTSVEMPGPFIVNTRSGIKPNHSYWFVQTMRTVPIGPGRSGLLPNGSYWFGTFVDRSGLLPNGSYWFGTFGDRSVFYTERFLLVRVLYPNGSC